MPQVPGLPIDRLRASLEGSYAIDRELGRGGMSSVFLAQDCKHRRSVAIKVLHPELAASVGAERFLQEIEVAARLSHPHILPLFDSGSVDDLLYYVMPYVEGESLRERLDREQQLGIEEAIHHARAIASAIDYASRQGIVHRDIKPENIMLYEGEAMVMDFGIAKAASAASAATLTQTGMVVGTPAYVSPEQAAGELNLDGRSDQYSLACVLYEMLTGERPFSAPTAQGMMSKRFTETARPLRNLRAAVPENVERAVERAMALEPTDRYPTAGQFGQALISTSTSTPSQTVAIPQVVSAAKSVAVLPFANMSTDADSEYFTDGMAEEIINALSKVQSLRVTSRTSSFAFKGKNEDIGEIGRKLKVSTVLEGSVRKLGNRLRITAQLINVADGYQLWSERYDREMQDVFEIQDDISQAIVKALRVILSDDEKKRIEQQPRAVNVEAYEFYLRGRQHFHQLRRSSLEQARLMFNKAIELDPAYALAHAGVADCYSLIYTYFDAREFNLRQAEAASARAVELQPGLAEAHLSRGMAVSLSKRFDEAEQEFEQAIALGPQLFEAFYWYGQAKLSQGKFTEAIKLFERAASLRPEDYQISNFVGLALKSLGRHDEAMASYRKQLRLGEEHLARHPDDSRACIMAANAWANLQDAERSAEFAARATAMDPDDPMVLYNVACLYGVLGRTDDCLTALEQSVNKGWGDKAWLEHDSDFDSVRGEPRYLALIRSM
jgi:serine/threonine protein kinase/Flp pilus assembly protein TadD